MMSLIHDINNAVGMAKRWGMLVWQAGLHPCLEIYVYDTRAADPCEKEPFRSSGADNLDDAMQMLFDLSNQGYEIFQTWGNPGIVSVFVRPSLDHSTNIDVDLMNSIAALFEEFEEDDYDDKPIDSGHHKPWTRP